MRQTSDNILIVDPCGDRGIALKSALGESGYNISIAKTRTDAKKRLSYTTYSLVLLQDKLPDMEDCLGFLTSIKTDYPETLVILIAEHFSQDFTIEAGRRGAYDFIENRCPPKDLKTIVAKSLERRRLGLKNKQLFVELQKKNEELEWRVKEFSALYEISKTIVSKPTLDEALKGLFLSIRQVIPVDYFLCLSFNADSQTFHLRFAQGIDKDIIAGLSLAEVNIGTPVVENMNREDMIIYYTNNLSQVFRMKGFYSLLFDSFLAVPILIEKDLYGLFVVASKQKNIFSDDQKQLLSIIASQALTLYEKASRLTKSTQLITMGQMISEIAHDLRHPITTIKGALQNLENKWYDDAFREKSLEVVNNGIFRLNELVKELLAFSSPDRFPLKTIDINKTLHKVLVLVQNDLLRHKIDLVQEISLLPPLQANEERIKEVFLNLIINAIESMENGGVLKISTALIKKNVKRPREYIRICFSDTGTGISAENQKKIFDHFYSTKKSGIGLGLAIVNRVIKTHNGFIEVQSEVGKGSAFSIYIPVEKEC